MIRHLVRAAVALAALTAVSAQAQTPKYAGPTDILNVSYDVSRELYVQIDAAFAADWKARTGQTIEIKQSHNGSSAQARAVTEGLAADVVTFNQVTDVQTLHDKGNFIPADWQKRLPNASSPYYSLPAFLVRGGNPKNIRDWNDLVRPDVKLVFPNPEDVRQCPLHLSCRVRLRARAVEGRPSRRQGIRPQVVGQRGGV